MASTTPSGGPARFWWRVGGRQAGGDGVEQGLKGGGAGMVGVGVEAESGGAGVGDAEQDAVVPGLGEAGVDVGVCHGFELVQGGYPLSRGTGGLRLEVLR